jgi:hypothetical protein
MVIDLLLAKCAHLAVAARALQPTRKRSAVTLPTAGDRRDRVVAIAVARPVVVPNTKAITGGLPGRVVHTETAGARAEMPCATTDAGAP